MSGQQSIAICSLGGLDRSWGTTQFLEYGSLPVFIRDVVTLKDDPTLKFTAGVRDREFGVLLNAYLKDSPNVYSSTFPEGLGGNFRPWPHARLIPYALASQLVPFGLQGSLRLGVGHPFSLPHRACHEGIDERIVCWDILAEEVIETVF
jgi:hypothetical protein